MMTAKKIVEGLREREFTYRLNAKSYEIDQSPHSIEANSWWASLAQTMKEAADYIEAKEKEAKK